MALINDVQPTDSPYFNAGAKQELVPVASLLQQSKGAQFTSRIKIEIPGRPLPADSASKTTPGSSLRGVDRTSTGQFTLGQNYPNPYVGETTIPFALPIASDVRLDLFDLVGRKMASICRPKLSAGEHTINLNLTGLGLAAGDYTYQLQVINSGGVYRQSKLMTAT